MEQYILCVLLHVGMHRVCWVVQTTTQCSAELDDWTERALGWTRRNRLTGSLLAACWKVGAGDGLLVQRPVQALGLQPVRIP